MTTPHRIMGLVDPLSVDADTLLVGKCFVGAGGLRVGLSIGGLLLHLSPAGARRFAEQFETEVAREHDLGWIADAVREAADEIDALRETKQ